MVLEYIFFTTYIVLIFWMIPKILFIRNAQLSALEITILLAFKILSGIAFAFYFEKISTSEDYISNNLQGKIQYELLLSNPKFFFTDFSNDFHTYGLSGLLDSKDSFWAYLRFNLLFKFIAILNLVTHCNFYFNTVIFSSIVFFGHIAFYRIYSEIYKGHKLKILFATFCLPSLLLYTSCIHKDGIIFLCVGLISYAFYRILTTPGAVNFKFIAGIFFSLLTIFLFRNYVIIAIIPALATVLACRYLPYKKRFVLLITYSVFFVGFFLSGFSNSLLNLPAAVVQRKADFASLSEGNTNISMHELYPTVQSFISNLPQAINHYFLRPYLWEFSQPAVLLTALELLVYQMIFLAFIFFRKKRLMTLHLFNIFGLAFVFNMALIIGYTIPNIGAIVRYRSIFWVFLICPMLCTTDWKRLFSFRRILFV